MKDTVGVCKIKMCKTWRFVEICLDVLMNNLYNVTAFYAVFADDTWLFSSGMNYKKPFCTVMKVSWKLREHG